MISQVSKDIAIRLFEANWECYQIIKSVCDQLRPSYLATQLQDLANTYIHNNQDLNGLFQLGSIERLHMEASDSTPALSVELQDALRIRDSALILKEVLAATRRVGRAYRDGIECSRELSEKLPHQYARVDRACRIARSLFTTASELHKNANSANN